jgi:hypothetical protein
MYLEEVQRGRVGHRRIEEKNRGDAQRRRGGQRR